MPHVRLGLWVTMATMAAYPAHTVSHQARRR